MDEILADLAAQHAELDSLLAPLDDAGWNTPSACPGWSISDVVLHLAQTDEMAAASARGTLAELGERLMEGLPPAENVDDMVGHMVAKERGAPPSEVYERWQTATADSRAALAECAPSDRVSWVAGTLSARTLATTRLSECWIHTTDVAEGLGVDLAPTDRLMKIARLAWRTLPYAFTRAGKPAPGPVAFELAAPDGSTWTFAPDEHAPTVVTGTALDLCRVAGQRARAHDTSLCASGPDAADVLALVRTFA